MKSRIALVLIVGVWTLVIGCSEKPETLTHNYDEQKMEQAIAEARSTFDTFVDRFMEPQPGDADFHVKVKIEDENGIEHFWVSDLKLDAEPYFGIIGNDPGIVKNVKLGQVYSFTREDISDWLYMSNGVMQGNYTLRVILESMPPEEAKEVRQQVGW